MYAADLVELAAIVADHAPGLIEAGRRLPDEALVEYWSASKCRLQRWANSLKKLSTAGSAEWSADGTPEVNRPITADPPVETTLKGVLEEILTSEALTRVWAATATAHDRRRAAGDVEPIVRSVYAGHLEARNRTLVLLARGPGVSSHDAVTLNRLRRRAERWTDLLLGRLLLHVDVAEFTFDADLAREFARDFRGQQTWQRGGQAWSLALASLRTGLCRDSRTATGNEALNAQIVSAVVGCFGSEMFDATGLPRTHRAATSPEADHQAFVDAFFAHQRPEVNLAPRMRRLTDPR